MSPWQQNYEYHFFTRKKHGQNLIADAAEAISRKHLTPCESTAEDVGSRPLLDRSSPWVFGDWPLARVDGSPLWWTPYPCSIQLNHTPICAMAV